MKVNPVRVDLAETFPLPGPLTVVMESTSRCNFACSFCPTSRIEDVRRVGLTKQDMSEELFAKILADLSEFPKLKQFHFHYDGEPTLNPNLPKFVKLASSFYIADDYMIRTNGSNLTKEVNRQLVSCGLTRIGISVEAVSEDGYRKLTGRRGMFNRVVDGVTDLYSRKGKVQIYAKIIDFGLPETDPAQFHQIFDPITDLATIEYPMQWNNGVSDSTLGNGVRLTVNGDYKTDHIACPYPLYTMGISSSGKVNACCFDWSWATTFGNVNTESLYNIWHGSKRKEFLQMHFTGNRSNNPACRDCTAHYACPDNIDDKRSAMVGKLWQT